MSRGRGAGKTIDEVYSLNESARRDCGYYLYACPECLAPPMRLCHDDADRSLCDARYRVWVKNGHPPLDDLKIAMLKATAGTNRE